MFSRAHPAGCCVQHPASDHFSLLPPSRLCREKLQGISTPFSNVSPCLLPFLSVCLVLRNQGLHIEQCCSLFYFLFIVLI